MDLEKKLQIIGKIDNVYSYRYFTSESIIKDFDLDISIVSPKQEQLTKLAYGEVTKNSATELYNFLLSKLESESDLTFCDIGSGNGKLIFHLSLISKFKKLIGLEINKTRYELSEILRSKNINDYKNVEFLNIDATEFDFSMIDVVFMYDILFEKEDIKKILKKLKPNTHVISVEENGLVPESQISLNVDCMELPIPFKYYKI